MALSTNAVNGGINGVGGVSLFGLTIVAIFGNYATEWTLLFAFITTTVMVANSVAGRRRGVRELQLKEERAEREKEAHNKVMGPTPDKIEGVTNADSSRNSEED